MREREELRATPSFLLPTTGLKLTLETGTVEDGHRRHLSHTIRKCLTDAERCCIFDIGIERGLTWR